MPNDPDSRNEVITRKKDGKRLVRMFMYISEDAAKAARHVCVDENKTVSSYITSLIMRDVKRRAGPARGE